MRIGITGHQTLRGTLGWDWIEKEIQRVLAKWCPHCVGITSLATGADQRFAKIMLEMGGAIEVVVPFPEYETRIRNEDDRCAYRRLLGAARAVLTLSGEANNDELSYLVAGQRVVDRSDLLLAVWDGKPAAGVGGTADIVAYARLHDKRIAHVNPVTGDVPVDLTRT